MGKKITIEDLLERAKTGESLKSKDIFIKSLGGEITIQQLKSESIIFRALSKIDEAPDDMENIMDSIKELIYQSCSILRNKELQSALECAEPYDVVPKVMTISERSKLFEEILILNGFDQDDISTVIKNA